MQAASQLAHPEAREAVPSVGAETQPVFDRTKERVNTRLEAIRTAFAAHKQLHARYGDAVADIGNHRDAFVENRPN